MIPDEAIEFGWDDNLALPDPPEIVHLIRGTVDPETFHNAIRADSRLAAELAYCARNGIPRRVFLGRVVQPGEPTWTAYDRDWAIAYERWTAGLCHRCGMHTLDWPHQFDDVTGHDPFMVEYISCWSCKLLDQARAAIPTGRDTPEVQTRLVVYDESLDADG